MQVEFWGVRGSYPCWGAGKETIGGNTACASVYLKEHDTYIIFDAGSGLIELGQRLIKEGAKRIIIVISHFHIDHMMGLHFFKPLWNPNCQLIFYSANGEGDVTLQQILQEQLFAHPLFPVTYENIPATLEFQTVQPGAAFEVLPGVMLKTCALNHPGHATGFRVEYISGEGPILCYVSDHEQGHAYDRYYNPDSLLDFVQHADLMIFDAMYAPQDLESHKGWGHSTWQEGIQLAHAGKVKKIALFHVSPEYDDSTLLQLEEDAKKEYKGAVLAREGMSITL